MRVRPAARARSASAARALVQQRLTQLGEGEHAGARLGEDLPGRQEPQETQGGAGVGAELLNLARATASRAGIPMVTASRIAYGVRLLAADATQAEVVDILAADPSRISTIVRRLKGCGLIIRSWGHGDRRLRVVEVTGEGRAAVGRIESHLNAHSPIMVRLDEPERCAYAVLPCKLAGFDISAQPPGG